MYKEDFISLLVEMSNFTDQKLTPKSAAKIIERFARGIIMALSEKKSVHLVGFGKFYAKDIKQRNGRNPRTGSKIKIKAYRQPYFKAGKKLKDAANSRQKD